MNRSAHALGSGQLGEVVDFNIHDLIGIRLVNPSARDVQIVERHLGLAPAGFSGSASLTVNFVERLTLDQPLRFLGRDDVAFTDEAFVVLRSRNLARARASLAMDRIGESCDMTCESGLPAIPLLRQLINLVMLAKGIVPVHAAAFEHHGRGVMITGWSHGSKTGTMLAFMSAGAKFVGDEWIYVGADGNRIYGLPDQLEARPWYLQELPKYRRRVGLFDRFRIGLTSGAAASMRPLVPRSERRNSLSSKLVRQIHQSLLDQQSVHLRPLDLFGSDACALSAPLDLVIVAVSHEAADVLVAAASIDRVAGQMASSFVHEHSSLTASYQKHLFAFPDRRNPLLDDMEGIYRQRAADALRHKRTYTMLHPYPVSIAELRNAVGSLLSPGAS